MPMNRSPPTVKAVGRRGRGSWGSTATRRRGPNNRSKSSVRSKTVKTVASPVIDLTSFGFSRNKRPAPVDTAAAAGEATIPSAETVSSSDNNNNNNNNPAVVPGNTVGAAAPSSSSLSSSPEIEIVASPSKRARRRSFPVPTPVPGTSPRHKTASASTKKIGAGKENGSGGASAAAPLPAEVFSSSPSPPRNSVASATATATEQRRKKKASFLGGGGGSKRKSAPANYRIDYHVGAAGGGLNSNSNAKASDTASSSASARVALLDLTQDSSSDNSSQQRRDNHGPVKRKPAAKRATKRQSQHPPPSTVAVESSATRGEPATLSGMAEAIASKIDAQIAASELRQQQNRNQQRRGKREKWGLNREGSTEPPIPIFEDNNPAATPPPNSNSKVNHGAQKKPSPAKAKPTKAKSQSKAKSPPKGKSPLKAFIPLKGRSTPKTNGPLKGKSSSKVSSPPKVIRSNGKKIPSFPQKQLSRGSSIQSYFSASSPSKTKAENAAGLSTKEKIPLAVESSPKSIANTPTKTSPARSINIRANALGLVRVANPSKIYCTTAVAQARQLFFDPNDESLAKDGPRRIYPGAVLGRSSSGRASAKPRPDFVDIGIPHNAAGISRNHVKILNVKALGATEERHRSSLMSQASTASSASETSSARESLLLQVHEKSSNGVVLYRNRRGSRLNTYVKQGEKWTLRIGDAVEFLSNEAMYFCVVGLFYDDSREGGDGEAVVASGGEWAAGGGDPARTLEFTPPEREKAPSIRRDTGNVTVRKKAKKKRSGVVAKDDVDVVCLMDDQEDIKENCGARKDETEARKIDAYDERKINSCEFTQPLALDEGHGKAPSAKINKDSAKASDTMLNHETVGASSASTKGRTALSPLPRQEAAAAVTADQLIVPMSATRLSSLKAECAPHPDMDVTIELDSETHASCNAAVVTMDLPQDSEDKIGEPVVEREVTDESFVPDKRKQESMAVAANDKVPAVTELTHPCEKNAVASPQPTRESFAPKDGEKDAPIRKGDEVKVLYEKVSDMFDEYQTEWYMGTVIDVNPDSIRVKYQNGTFDTVEYPCEDVKILETSINESVEYYFPETFGVGDIVDAKFRDEDLWYRGRVVNVNQDGKSCDIMYYDQDHEAGVPTKQNKIRLYQRCKPCGEWLMGKSLLLTSDEGNDFRTGTVSKKLTESTFQVTLSDASKESVSQENVAKAAFEYILKDIPVKRRHEWPVSMIASRTERIRTRRERKDRKKAIDDWFGEAQKPEVKSEQQPRPKVEENPPVMTGRTRSSSRAASSKNAVKVEATDTDDIDTASVGEHDYSECPDLQGLSLHGPAVAPSVLEMRKTAKDIPPGLPNVLWCALNSPEAETGANFLRDLLCIHDSVPPSTMVQKLMELMKYGPKAEGSSVYFKDPHRIELVTEYVCGLVSASSRLVRKDGNALFGPSSWDDIEVLLSQSIVETENMISGRRLAQGLMLAARGAKLLSLMLTTEMQRYNLYTSSVTFDAESLKAMPTVRFVMTYGARSALNTAVRHTTKCLVRHSRWVMDQGDLESSSGSGSVSTSDECCALEARACLDSLGIVICTIAWLFCVEERTDPVDPTVAFVIKDAFLAELERCMEDVPEMNESSKRKFVKKLKMYFVLSLGADFCTPIVVSLGKMIGVKDELALVGLVV